MDAWIFAIPGPLGAHAELLALFPAGSALDLRRVFVDAVAAELYRQPRAA